MVIDYLQEIGRAGRDGLQSTACLYYNASDLGQTGELVIHTDMKEFITTNSCRRKVLACHFKFEIDAHDFDNAHDCCDNCKSNCDCDECMEDKMKILTIPLDDNDMSGVVNEVNGINEDTKQILKQYFDFENLEGEHITGLTDSLLNALCTIDIDKVTSEYVQSLYPNLTGDVLENIITIMLYSGNIEYLD